MKKTAAKWASNILGMTSVAFAVVFKGFIGAPDLPKELNKNK
ncbi:hypothetical protein [Brevibacillus reuszeri]|nr:hypothetical protein [Brevibacillus reuszeri]